MNLIRLSVRQPVTIAVGIILVLLAGIVAIRRIPIQLTPNVEDTIVAVTTHWEGASPVEVEQEIVDRQEEKLQGIPNLVDITSTSQQDTGLVRLEFKVGTPKEEALREVSDKLREVPKYPDNVDEPVIEASDPENRDYIAWIVLQCGQKDFDVRTLQDFAEDRLEPVLERVPGVSEINVLGGREREVQVRFDPTLLAAKGITPSAFVQAIERQNHDVSAGALEEAKNDVRVRLAGQFTRLEDVENTVIAYEGDAPVFVRDVADVADTYKEPVSFVHSRGQPVLAINAQKEVGANVMSVMDGIKDAVARLNRPGGVLDTESRQLGLSSPLRLEQVYDQTIYIDDALALVKSNIWVGGALAVLVLVLYLRSFRPVAIITLAIPISVVGAVVAMVAMGRTINVISLAGMAFAVGMVVDNAIVVLENIYRHLEMGKTPVRAAIDGGREVYGAVLASTLTTVAVFIPILLIQEEAGQLFRDISLAIVAAVFLSLVVSVTVIPASAARLLRRKERLKSGGSSSSGWFADRVAGLVHRMNGSIVARLVLVAVLTLVSVLGTIWLIPPTDYLPQGNRNLVFGLLIPPPGYNLDQLEALAGRIEDTVRPFWDVSDLPKGSPERAKAEAALPSVPTFDMAKMAPGPAVVPPPLENYFIVSFNGIMFHGGISDEPERVVDLMPLFQYATRAEVAPGVLAFAFQVPLFRLGGRTGSAIKINFSGDDLQQTGHAALATMLELIGRYGPQSCQPDPSNFNVPTPELRLVPDRVRLAESGLSFDDVAFAVQALGDGALIGDYRKEGDSIDLKVISKYSVGSLRAIDRIPSSPLATPLGGTVLLSSVTKPVRVNSVQQINRVNRQRAVTLQFTPPHGMALEQGVNEVAAILDAKRAAGEISPDVETSFTGSASKLAAVQNALLGDGTPTGTLGSSLFLALMVVYLLMCVLFQSFVRPLIIMFSVPLATLGGFAALRGVYVWSTHERYLPVQQLDILTMLGFVILIGVVVNNAILIVHQSLNFMRGVTEEGEDPIEPMGAREAITEAVRSRVRPIFMSSLTSVGGMLPLVLMPGSGSELYRGLGSVVCGGLLVSTIFTLLLVPALFSLVTDLQLKLGWGADQLRGFARTAVPVGGAAVVLFLACFLPGLGGCAAGRAPSYPQAAQRMAQDVVDATPSAPQPVVPQLPETDVAKTLGPRLPELEKLGGAESWSALPPALGEDLTGTAQAVQPIDLGQAVGQALTSNLGLRSAQLEPKAGAAALEVAHAAFDPALFADLEAERLDQPRQVPVLNGIPLGTPSSASQRVTLQAGVRKLLATGAMLSASSYLERFDNQTSGIAFSPNPQWRSGVGIEATQPLLQGFGSEVTEQNVALAKSQLGRTREEARSQALIVGAMVEQAYWTLREAKARLLIQQDLTNAGEEVERVLGERRAFDAAPAQYADALATVEQRRSDLIRARLALQRASDQLKSMLDSKDHAVEDEHLLDATTDFHLEPFAIDLHDAIATAVQRRPELVSALLDIQDADLRERVAKNLRQPRLDLMARLDAVGQDDTLGGSGKSLGQDDFYSWLLGLHFEVPLGNRAAKAEERRLQVEARRSLLGYEALLRDVVLEVKDSLRSVGTSYQLVGAARAFRIAQTENLRALLAEEERRSSLTPEFLRLKFDRQDRLARAQLDEVQAVADYDRSLAAFHRAIGTGPDLEP